MFAYQHSQPLVLGSVCPSSCALVAFALRMGGTIDPEFLLQCQILDPKFQKAVDSLKSVPLKFEPSPSSYGYQEDIFLDIDTSNGTNYYDSWSFKQHNTWIGSTNQWDSTYALNDDIVIDFI